MARVYLRADPGLTKVYYTVDQAVGQGCPNRRDDVLLIQFFLRVALEDGGDSPGYRPPGQGPISIDGVCGSQTIAYIKFMQEEGKRRNPGHNVAADCRIDPIRSGQTQSSLGFTYGIVGLNVLYAKRRGPTHDSIKRDPLFPAELTPSLYVGG